MFITKLTSTNWLSRLLPLVGGLLLLLGFATQSKVAHAQPTYSFDASGLYGVGVSSINNPTSLQFGPDDLLYISQQNGTIHIFEVVRNGPNDYESVGYSNTNAVKSIQNYNDDGTFFDGDVKRQVTGILVTGTPDNPVLYVSNSHYEIGGGGTGADKNLDTNSGTISRLTWVGSSRDDPSGYWDHVELIRGLPRSEENHANNGLVLDEATNTLYVASGGSTNAGSPSNNFAFITEYAYSAAILSIDLDAIEAMPIQEATINGKLRRWVYDLPTLDDPTRPNVNGIIDPSDSGYDGVDVGDPFGGNDGLNQAKVMPGSPVQIYSPGYRNAYDLVIREDGKMYIVDNGANGGWGGFPDNEGPTGVCTNNWIPGEPGSNSSNPYNGEWVNNKDNLHYVTGEGFYGGHPTPIRGNPGGAGLFTHNTNGAGTDGVWRTSILPVTDPDFATESLPVDWPPYPEASAYPIECDYLQPGVNDGALMIFNTSTNGITEYTASNFGGELQGDLLLASFDGTIYRADISSDGTSATKHMFASGFGASPLDVIAQSDGEIFPGTVWAATYGADNVTIFEPTDCVAADPDDDTIDDDSDGYTNYDETQNGTDPCSGASKPDDFDAADGPEHLGTFLRSNLLDTDDDNDTLLDTYDPFPWDANNGIGTELPFNYPLLNGDPGFGFYGLGFTGLVTDGTPASPGADYLNMFDGDSIIAGGAVGLLTVQADGTMVDGTNTLTHGFQFGLDVMPGQGPFTIESQINSPFFDGNPVGSDDLQGIFIGSGDQDNYIWFGLTDTGFALIAEDGGVSSRTDFAVPSIFQSGAVDPSISTFQLFLEVDPLNDTVIPGYTVNGTDPITYLGSPVAVTGDTLAALNGTHTIGGVPSRLAVGIMATNASAAYGATYDYFDITTVPSDASTHFQVNTGGLNSSTFNGGFSITNTSVGGLTIENVTIDMSTNAIPDIVFDPFGDAGDTVAKPFTPQNNAGFVVGHSYGQLDSSGHGYYQLDIEFDDFVPGEEFTFAIDIDPISIQGSSSPGPEESGSVSGLELAGATVTVEYSNGEIQTGQLYRKDMGTMGNAEVIINNTLPPAPSLAINGQPTTPIIVVNPNQTVTVAGTPGNTVGLLILEGGMFVEGLPVPGGVNVDPFDINSIVAIQEFDATIGSGGTVEIPVTLTNRDGDSVTGVNYIMAVVKESGNITGYLSNVEVLHYDPTAVGTNHYRVNAGGPEVSDTPINWTIDSAGNQVYSTGGATFGGTLNTNTTSAPDAIFSNERYGESSWAFPVDPATYTVNLYFMEGYGPAMTPAGRVFDIAIEGVVPAIFDDFDIYIEAGEAGNVGIVRSYDVTVTDGTLNIDFINIVENAAIRGIEVVPQGTSSTSNLIVKDESGSPISEVNFFATAQGSTSAPITITLENAGDTDPIDITSIGFSGADAVDFDVTPASGISLPAGETATYDLTFTPSRAGLHTATLQINHDGDNGPLTELAITGEGISAAAGVVEFRVNVGGAQVAAADGSTPVWSVDTNTTASPYRVTTGGENISSSTSGSSHSGPIIMTHPSLAAAPAAPVTIFEKERWDLSAAPEMEWEFPVTNGETYEVRLYFAELFGGITAAGQRQFDISIEGVIPANLDNIDQYAIAGPKGAFMLTHTLIMGDDTLDIDFAHIGVENPAIKAIEIIRTSTPSNFPPVVDNPGNQTNFVGDTVNLPINVTDPDGDDFTCSDTNLPDGLSMDPSTCVITGTPTNTCSAILAPGSGHIVEQGGLAVVDVDYAPPTDDWTIETTVAGGIGGSYYEWRTGNSSTGVISPGLGVLQYPIEITTPGIYRFQMRSAAPDVTEHNDVWMRFSDADAVFGIKSGFPTTSSNTQTGYHPIGVNTWVKVFQNSGGDNWTWSTKTKDNDGHNIYVEFSTAGSYMMEVSGRSTMFKLDRLVLWQQSVGMSTATNTVTPISPTMDGSTCTYNVSITAEDDGSPTLSTTINFEWAISLLATNFAPTIDPIDDQNAVETLTLNVDVSATDVNGDAIFLSIAIEDEDTNPVDTGWYTFTDNGDGTADFVFMPPIGSAGVYTATVTADDTQDTSTEDFEITVTPLGSTLVSVPLFRVNVGGTEVAAADSSSPVWSEDTNVTPSVYRVTTGGNNIYNGNTGSAHPGSIIMTHPSLADAPAAPAAIFNIERWDSGSAPEMQWEFPVTSGSTYEVRLYFAELFGGITAAGQRQFDVAIEGAVPANMDNIDQYATAGPKGAFMLSHTITAGDDILDIDFAHISGLDNPALKGIEILEVSTDAVMLAEIQDQTTTETATLGVDLRSVDVIDETITLSVVVEDSSATVIPEGTFYNLVDNGDGTGIINFTPQVGDADTYNVTATATSVNGSDNQSFSLTVLPLPTDLPSATILITPTGGLGASTYDTNGFIIQNTSSNPAFDITSVSFDLSTAVLPDMVFDPLGGGGDASGKCLTPDSGEADTGYVEPAAGNCDTTSGTLFSGEHNGGYDVVNLTFDDFNPGENFGFSVDIDPNNIKDSGATGDAGAVSGLELIGSTVVVMFSDGTIYTTELYTIPPANNSGSQTVAAATMPTDTVALDVQGLTLSPEGTADTDVANQTIVITGPANAEVSLTHLDTRLHFTQAPDCGFDVTVYDANEVMAINETLVTLDGSGQALVPVTLLATPGGGVFPDGGFNYFTAAVVDASTPRQNGLTSNTVILAYPSSNEEPRITSTHDDETISEGDSLSVPITACDVGTDVEPALSATIVDQATLTPVADGFFSVTDNGDGTGTLDITTGLDDAGVYTVTIIADDGDLTGTAVFTLTVENTNQDPVIDAIANVNITEGDTTSVTVTASDPDEDTVTFTPGTLPAFITWNGADTFDIAPTVGDSDGSPYTITVNADDGNSGTDNTSFQVFVSSVTDTPPVIDVNVPLTVEQGDTEAITSSELSASDAEQTAAELIYAVTTAPVNGTLTNDGTPINLGDTFTQADIDNELIAYTHDGGATTDDSFDFDLTDSNFVTNGTFFINVTPPNVPPVAEDDEATVVQDIAETIDVVDNDADADGTIDVATVVIVDPATNGNVVPDGNGNVVYTPDAGYLGPDSFTYTVDDNAGATSNVATVTIEVVVGNEAPVAEDDEASTSEDTPVNIDVLENDTDDQDSFDFVTIETEPANGVVVVNGDQTVTYTPDAGFVGEDTFTYTVTDTGGLTSNEATVTVNVTEVVVENEPPVLVNNIGLEAGKGDLVTITADMLLVTDADTGPADLTFEITQPPINGTLLHSNIAVGVGGMFTQADINAGLVAYQHDDGVGATDSFTFVATDGTSSLAPAVFPIEIVGLVGDEPMNLDVEGDMGKLPLIIVYEWTHKVDPNATNVPGSWYHLVIMRDGVVIVDEWVNADEVCEGVVCSFTYLDKTPPYVFEPGDYTWWIEAWIDEDGDGVGEIVTSEPEVFSVDIPAVSPVSGVVIEPNQGRPTISWDDDPAATWFQLYLGNPQTMVFFEWIPKSDELCDGTRCEFTPDINPFAGAYDFWMRSWGPISGFSTGGIQGWDGPYSVSYPDLAPSIVTEMTATRTNSGLSSFSWNGVEGGTWYRLWVGQPTGDNEYETWFLQWMLGSDLGCENMGVCGLTLTSSLPNGTYNWAVQVWGPGGYNNNDGSIWSAIQTFNVGAGATGVPVPGSPNGIASLGQPVFTWESLPDVSHYQVWIDNVDDAAETDPIWYSVEELGCVNAGEVCELHFGDVAWAAGTYQWALQAYSPAGLGEWSNIAQFTIQ